MKTQPHSSWRRTSLLIRCLLVLGVLLISARLALPYWIKDYVNRQLRQSPDYHGSVKKVTVHLWRGAYKIWDPEIFKTAANLKEPFFAARQIDLSLEWRELIHGAMVGSIVIEKPEINFVVAPTAQESQVGTNTPWISIVNSLFPVNFNRVEVQGGQIHFANHHSTPPVDVLLKDVQGVVTNLSNTPDLKTNLPAGLTASGSTSQGGGLTLNLRLDPKARAPTFELTGQVTNVDLVALNDIFRAYGKFDVDRGQFALYASVAAKEGLYDGYMKVFFDNLSVFAWDKERHKNILKVFWDAIVGTVATIFKNQPHDRLAARVPISGGYGTNHVDILTAVGSLLHNAFIRALIPKLDEKVSVNAVPETADKDARH